MRSDRPRLWILSDDQLSTIAISAPQSRSELAAISDLPRGLVKRRADALVGVVSEADRDFAEGRLLPPPIRERDPARQALMRELRQKVTERAAQLGIAAEVLGSRRDLAALLDNDNDCRLTAGWRKDIIGADLLALRD